jgi:hypothetical protein
MVFQWASNYQFWFHVDKNILFPDLPCSTSHALSASECEVQASQKFQSMEIWEAAEESVSTY